MGRILALNIDLASSVKSRSSYGHPGRPDSELKLQVFWGKLAMVERK